MYRYIYKDGGVRSCEHSYATPVAALQAARKSGAQTVEIWEVWGTQSAWIDIWSKPDLEAVLKKDGSLVIRVAQKDGT